MRGWGLTLWHEKLKGKITSRRAVEVPLKLGDKLRETKSDSDCSVSSWVGSQGDGGSAGLGKSDSEQSFFQLLIFVQVRKSTHLSRHFRLSENCYSIMILLAQNPSWPIFCKILELHIYYNNVYYLNWCPLLSVAPISTQW